jgi:hypothetical protein
MRHIVLALTLSLVMVLSGCGDNLGCFVEAQAVEGDIGEDGSYTSPNHVWAPSQDALLSTFWPGPVAEVLLPDTTSSVEMVAAGYDVAGTTVGITFLLVGDDMTGRRRFLAGPVSTSGPYPPRQQTFTLDVPPGSWSDLALMARSVGIPGDRKLIKVRADICTAE